MRLLKGVCILIGIFVTIQFMWWTAREVGYALDLCAEPRPGTFWLVMAYAGAALLSLGGDLDAIEKWPGA